MTRLARAASSVALVAALVGAFACSSGNKSSCGAGVTLVGDHWASACESWMEQYCCNDMFACGGDPACTKGVSCIAACPSPRTVDCINACNGGFALGQMQSCITTPPTGSPAVPAGCSWPE